MEWSQTPLRITESTPENLSEPTLPSGPLVDAFGQSTVHEWEQRSESRDEITERLRRQYETAADASWPERFSRWGGDRTCQFESTGFFRTTHDGDRWWFVDPDGHPFVSVGMNCVRPRVQSCYDNLRNALTRIPDPETVGWEIHDQDEKRINHLADNFWHAFGDDWHKNWQDITEAFLRETGFNTIGNWSNQELIQECDIPYVRTLDPSYERVPTIYRGFPDVYHDEFSAEAASIAEPLVETRDDPALLGYFLENEPVWIFGDKCPAAGMLYNTEQCASRAVLVTELRKKYGDSRSLSDAWNVDVTFSEVETGRWKRPLTDTAREDLKEFSTKMVDRLYGVLSEECRKNDPNHLNLGVRYILLPPEWAEPSLKHFDVITSVSYLEQLPVEQYRAMSERYELPILVGEWHFGALDVGLPAYGICQASGQAGRASAYRKYIEHATSQPWCVGTHYFELYDQSPIGRFDGENYNIGFLDVCNNPYEELVTAARKSNGAVYELANGEREPYSESNTLLTHLFPQLNLMPD
ncbi:hypothetical protein [Natrinema halophilum]|uniref:Glycoside hydrolase family 42 N-terminal domain-containing protein n=1 Tax=Natrinema halophilum TaxID=1699371 RepID=A0A7D5GP28_9EURY|nr:hypothetical protein [Natrinema halophilum]QLG49953.1 hypothetical protein HYG82_14375 [Natrinema halophilum]